MNGILKSQANDVRCPLVVLIDPQNTDHSERNSVAKSFGAKGYMIREAAGAQATVQNARYLTEFMPSDVVFYSTHCGEVKGQRVKETLATDGGAEHKLIYERVISLSRSPSSELIEVLDLKRFISLNDIPWSDEEGKHSIQAGSILELYMNVWKSVKLGPSPNRSIQVEDCGPVRFSDCLKMIDGVYKPVPQLVGGWMHPIVMNNACSSCRELASWFIGKGASGYIGTTRDTPDSMSSAVATTFADLIAKGAFVGKALFESQKGFSSDLGYSPYLLYGYLFNNLPPPAHDKKPMIEARIQEMLAGQITAPDQSENHQTQIKSVRIFLEKQLEGLRQHETKQE